MKVLIIEDDDQKSAQLRNFLGSFDPAMEVIEARSYMSGLTQLLAVKPAVVLLDMTLPTYDSDDIEGVNRIRTYGGKEILGDIVRRRIATKVAIITHFETFGEGADKKSLEQV